ncbi:hypothetical protein D1B31_15160 [Neobacillus notoginsengisoli]|uniref:DUF5316 domain-containing protein n=1 Tax=Neobacillus notoginsengisoli TaxID=1578198 RepID=A0A417YS33_9BACI|nr:DUF5316 domain-containing protein [Neobacillus notoginsengisoli]RHW38113.1 hypothetical protein D1B31_15160 [Neobacillus notoginsengisoli]
MKVIMSGAVLAVIASISSSLIWGADHAYILPGGIGLAAIGISAIFSGSLVSGDRIRANYQAETKEDRASRHLTMKRFGLFGMSNLAAAVILYMKFH